MPRRFSKAPLLFFALWALWFVLPSTREAARSDWVKVASPPDPSATLQPVQGTSRDALVAGAMNASDQIKGHTFETLGQKFPRDATICAAQLLYGVSQLKLGQSRQPGPASSADANWSVKLAKIERPSPSLLRSWFAATARGAQLEPNNTFWDWMQIVGLLAARRDNEVWPILKAAKSKTVFDDHTTDLSAAVLREQRLQHGPLPVVSQLNLSFNSSFAIYSALRQATRALSEDAYGLRLQKTPQSDRQALEGMRDMIFASRTVRRESKWLIGSLVGEALETISFWGGGFSASNGRRGRVRPGAKTLARYATDSRSLLRFARLQKRTDIAAQLASEWVALGAWRVKAKSAFRPPDMDGVDGGNFSLAWAGDWLDWRLLAPFPLALGLIGLSSLALRFVPPLRRESEVRPSRASWVWGAVLGLLSVLILASSMLWQAGAALKMVGTSLANLGFALNEYTDISNQNTLSGAPRAWNLAFPSLFLLVSALWFAAAWDARRRGQPSLGARLKRVFHAPEDGLARFDVSPLFGLTGVLATLFLGSAAMLAYLIVPAVNSDFASWHDYAGWALLLFFFLLALPALWRLRSAPGRAFALVLARRFTWAFLVLMSLAWGTLALASVPAHRTFEAQLDRYLQVGEFQLARKRLGI